MIDLKPACRRMNDVLAGVQEDHLALPSPCTEFTVGDLVDHVAGFSRAFTSVARAHSGEQAASVAPPSATNLPQNWYPGLSKSVLALGDAWDDPAAWEGQHDAGVGLELPNEQWGRIALTELVVHGWDLAHATGQDFELPDGTLRACFDHVAGFVDQAPIEGLWGPAVPVAPGAPLLDRVLGATGRRA